MPTKRRWISTIKILRELDPALLREALAMIPAYVVSDRNNAKMVASLRTALVQGSVPRALADLLHHVAALASSDGWEVIQRQAEIDGNRLDFDRTGLSDADRTVKAWLHAWPENEELLEHAYLRLHDLQFL